MRVAHILRKYHPGEWGGTETALQRLCTSLRQQDVESVVYAPAIPSAHLPDPLQECGCDIRRFHACVPVWGLSPQRRRQLISVGGNLMSFDLIRSLWRDRDISLVHSHTLGRIGSIGCKVAKFRRIPFIFSIHGGVLDLPPKIKAAFENPGFEGLEWGKVFGFLLRTRKLLEDADAIVTCNEREARLLREKHPRQRVITQAHGISAKLFRVNHRDEAVRAFPRIRDRDVLLCIGRLDQAKNQRWLIREAPAIFQRHPNALLVLLGACTNAAYGEELKQDIQRLGLEDKVLITGNLPPKDPVLIGLLQRARAVIVPSLAETFCIVIIEAWAAGAPVMCSRTTGAVALIRENHNGWLFDLQQPAQFHAALDEALSKPDVARSHVANATRLVNETFDADVLARDMKTFYETLIEEKRCAT